MMLSLLCASSSALLSKCSRTLHTGPSALTAHLAAALAVPGRHLRRRRDLALADATDHEDY